MKLTITLEIKGSPITLTLAEAEDLYLQLARVFRRSPQQDWPLVPVYGPPPSPDWWLSPIICGTGNPVPKPNVLIS